MTFTSEQLAEILQKHKAWREDASKGERADLREANLRGSDLSEADLREANLRGSDLREANLRGSDLRGSDLRGSDLRGSDLRGSNLRGSDLSEADLREANLRGADLYEADLYEARSIFLFNKASGRTCYAVIHGASLMVKAGCFWGTIDEFEKAAKARYGDDTKQNYSAQIAYLRVLELELKA